MDVELNEQEKMIQSAARDFALREVEPRAAEMDATAEFPLDLARQMGRMGYYGLAYPGAYGGSEAGYLAYALVIEQISRSSMTAGAIVAVSVLSQESLLRFGDEHQKQTFLPPLARGEVFGCFCCSFPKRNRLSSDRMLTATMAPAVMEVRDICSITRA